MLLKKPMGHEEIKREIKKYLETNDNEGTTIQNLWDITKAVLRGEVIAIQAFLKKKERQRRTVFNDKRTHSRRYYTHQYICP